jgi:molybdopterin synthase sulfur carrier subunit
MPDITIKYFAALREQAGRSEERRQTDVASAAELYRELQAEYGLSLDMQHLKVAINNQYCPLEQPLQSGDTVVFIPPVAGG